MKKIGIITIYDEDNYGNRLQNYAVQVVLEKLGFEVETIRNINIVDGIDYLEEAKKVNPQRREKFLEFNEKNIKLSKDIIYHANIPEKFHEDYDYFIIGSDQIWNHNFPDRFSDFVFADFAPIEKKIALSASFGINEISEEKSKLYEKVQDFQHISVREYAGKDILSKNFNKEDVSVLIDPTMMLASNEWEMVMVKPEKMTDKKYVLKYFLGSVSEERNNQIIKFANEKGYEIIDLLDKENDYYATGPSEFLYLINNAEIILTDSFHSCVFSILFRKPFMYFYREGNLKNINSRLETLFSKFEIKDRIFNGILDDSCLSYKFDGIDEKLKYERNLANDFLRKALNLDK